MKKDEGFYDDDYLDDEEEVEPVKKFSRPRADSRRRRMTNRKRRVSVPHSLR